MASSGIGVVEREVSLEVEFPVDVGGRPSSLSSDGSEKFCPKVDFLLDGFPPSLSHSDCLDEAPDTFLCILLPIRDDEDEPDLSRGLLGVRMGEWKNCCEPGRDDAGEGGAGREDFRTDTEPERDFVPEFEMAASRGLRVTTHQTSQ